MNNLLHISCILCLLLLLLTSSCTEEVATKPPTQKPVFTTPSTQNKPLVEGQAEQPKGILGNRPKNINFVKCTTNNKTLPKNTIEVPMLNITTFIGANETTLDKSLGDSHRIFEVKSSPACEVIFSKTLPINVSADFPYYLSKEAISEQLGLIGIRGFRTINVFDLAKKNMISNLIPQFLTTPEAADATSGMINNLWFDQNYLYGYAVDYGVFVFDMNNNGNSVLPIKEISGTQLFAFNRSNNKVDIIIPILNFTPEGNLDLKMINVFNRSVNINSIAPIQSKNKKYVLLKEAQSGTNPFQYLVIDLSKKEMVELPKAIATSPPEKILDFLK